MFKDEIRELFEKVLDAYVSSASDAIIGDICLEDIDTGEAYDEPEYKYEISRVNTKAEEWRKELGNLLDG